MRVACRQRHHSHEDRRARLTPRNLSSIVWALGSFGQAPSRLAFLLAMAEQRLEQFNGHDLANLLYGLAALERPDLAPPSLLAAGQLHAACTMTAFSPQVPVSLAAALLPPQQPLLVLPLWLASHNVVVASGSVPASNCSACGSNIFPPLLTVQHLSLSDAKAKARCRSKG